MSRKARGVGLSAAEFMTKHASELAESEDAISKRLVASIFPEGIPLSSLMTGSARLDAWLQGREKLRGYQLMRELNLNSEAELHLARKCLR